MRVEVRVGGLGIRVRALENILQGNGSYTSDYSGEEIDAMLAWVATQMGGST